MRDGRKKLVEVLNIKYTFYYSLMFLYSKKPSKSFNFKPLFSNLKVITDIYGQSQMRANFWCFYTVGSNFCFDDFENQHFSAFCSVNSVKT
jgi:hypothetical protein